VFDGLQYFGLYGPSIRWQTVVPDPPYSRATLPCVRSAQVTCNNGVGLPGNHVVVLLPKKKTSLMLCEVDLALA
jgi:hypothetical protein